MFLSLQMVTALFSVFLLLSVSFI